MRLVNSRVAQDLEQGKALRIDLGSGTRPRSGFYGLDQLDSPGVDIVADLNQPPHLLPDDCVEHLFSSHALEHVEKLLPLMSAIHRIMRPAGCSRSSCRTSPIPITTRTPRTCASSGCTP